MVSLETCSTAIKFKVIFRKCAVYLDTCALIHLAERDHELGRRFLALFGSDVDLLFSVTNAAELSGSRGTSFELMKAFLNEIGPYWIPVEMSAFDVAQREHYGTSPGQACVSEQFLKDYSVYHARNCSPGSGKIIDAADFTRLGPMLDWVGPQRDSIRQGSIDMDIVLKRTLSDQRAKLKSDPTLRARRFGPFSTFNPGMPATFATWNLIAQLVEPNSPPVKKGDGLDFCHAVMAAAFASFAVLDECWKNRIENCPQPNKLAKVYYVPELEQMVADIESLLNVPSSSEADN